MRVLGVALIASVVVSAVGCGGAARRPVGPPPPAVGAAVRITDGGQIFDALNTTDCVSWPSAEVKRRAGRDAWGAFTPDEGVEGKVLAALAHCDGRTQVVLVEVGRWVVPVTSRGVTVKEGPRVAEAVLIDEARRLQDVLAGGAIEGEWGEWGEYDVDWDGGDWDPDWDGLEGGVVGGAVGGIVGTWSPGYVVGDRVRVVDPGQTYDTIATTDCLTWPTQAMRDRARKGYLPKQGETGTVVGSSRHCSGSVTVVFVDLDNGQLSPVGESGLEHE